MTTSLLEALVPILDPLATGGAHFSVNDNEPLPRDVNGYVKPYIVFSEVISTDNVSLGGPTGLQNTRLQVDIFAPRALDAHVIRKAVEAALPAAFTTVPLTSQSLYEDAIKLHRVIREFSIWYDESAT